MPKILYRAIHTKNPWRKVSSHSSLEKALRGNDGARALFAGTARIDYAKHGQPIGVIVWSEGANTATAARPNNGSLQCVEIPIELALEAERRRGIEHSDFSALFDEDVGHLFPNELDADTSIWEGARKRVEVNRFERDSSARHRCIDHWGKACVCCHIDFSKAYGARGEGFIHVHHLTPMSEIGEEYELDPVADLRPVCPNCHAMIHRYKPDLTIEELKRIFRSTD